MREREGGGDIKINMGGGRGKKRGERRERDWGHEGEARMGKGVRWVMGKGRGGKNGAEETESEKKRI